MTWRSELEAVFQAPTFFCNELYKLLESLGNAPLVLDAEDILKDSEVLLKILCNKLEIPFYNEMLSWPAGRRESDGIWGRHWYGNVEASTGFHHYAEKTDDIPLKYQDIFAASLDSYQQLYPHRI